MENFAKQTFATMSLIVAMGLSTAFGQSRNANDYTIMGYGIDGISDPGEHPIVGANIEYKMLFSTGDSIFPPVNYQTDEQGAIYWDLVVQWELYVGTGENFEKVISTVRPNPGADFTINFASEQRPGEMYIIDNKGSLVDIVDEASEYRDEKAGYHVNLGDKADGIYYFLTKTPKGRVSGKLVKVGSNTIGYLGIGELPEEEGANHKSSAEEPYAVYQKTITADGFDTLVVEETIHEGDNGVRLYTLQEIGEDEIPQYQWIGGKTWKLDGDKLSGVIVELYDRWSDTLINVDTSDSQGNYLFDEPVPAGTDVYFKVRKNDDYRCWDGSSANYFDTYEVPDEIDVWGDTINSNLYFVMIPKVLDVPGGGSASPQSLQIRQMFDSDLNIEMALRDLKYYLDYNLSPSFKQAYRTNAVNFGNLIGHPGIMVESSSELNQGSNYDPYNPQFDVGINVRSGTDNTTPDVIDVTNPLGKVMYPVFSAETTLSGSGANIQYHETYLAMGGDVTDAWGGISNGNAGTPTANDKAILNMIVDFSKLIYDEGKAYFGIDSLVDEISDAPESPAVPSKAPNPPFKEISIPSVEYEYSSHISY